MSKHISSAEGLSQQETALLPYKALSKSLLQWCPPMCSALVVHDAAQIVTNFKGDSKALALVAQEGYRLALAIATIAAVLDPELVVPGGGIGQRVELLQGPLERRLQQLTPLRPRIVTTKPGDDSVLLGAIATALEMAHNLVFQHYFNGHATSSTNL